MDWRKKLSNDSNLYLILDSGVNNYKRLLEIAVEAVRNGVDLVQLRDKSGSAIEMMRFYHSFLKQTDRKIPFIVNDRVDVCDAAGATGVHLGQEDLSLRYARKILGDEKIIGISCQTIEQARKAQNDGADYIGFGSVFATQTKPGRKPMDLELLREVVAEIEIPVFAIGGINNSNIEILKKKGVRRFAVCRAICLSENVSQMACTAKKIINAQD
ncbi:MAG: thiamine phosphate synthase [Candidatus Omnitrophota bacterium]